MPSPEAGRGDVLGVQVSTIDRPRLLADLRHAVESRQRLSVSFVNPNYVMAAVQDPALRELMNGFDLLLPDGWGVVYGGRLLGVPIPDRLANDDIGEDVFEQSEAAGWRTFLFGSAPGVAERAAERLREAYPTLPLVGTLHGWFDAERGHPGWFEEDDEDLIVERINAAAPDVLWVGLPTPLQQRWVMGNLHRLDVPVVVTGGSYLDHLAERVRWYPRWALALRLCWLYRLGREPRRLLHRYTVELTRYAVLVWRARRTRRGLAAT